MSKELFQKHKELKAWWEKVVSDPQFDEVLLYGRSEFIDGAPGTEAMAGARRYENILKELVDAPLGNVTVPGTGLHFMPDQPGKKPKKKS